MTRKRNCFSMICFGMSALVCASFFCLTVSGSAHGQVTAPLDVTLDVDGDGLFDDNDALLISRYLYGFRGSVLTDAAVGEDCTRCTASAIQAYLATLTISSFFSNGLGMTFNLIPAGTFMMGSPPSEPGRWGDDPLHQVTLTQAFYMQVTEVTQGQWKAVMGTNPSYSGCGDNCPVETVSWDDVQEFITKMNQRGEGTYRLPTEAEWEYAARAGTNTPFYSGYCLSSDQANYGGCVPPPEGCPEGECRFKTIPVASFEPNGYGLYDMVGNVWEWCQDWYGSLYLAGGPFIDPTGPDTGSNRVFRGCSWAYSASYCRSAFRYGNTPDWRSGDLGFRLVLSPGQQR